MLAAVAATFLTVSATVVVAQSAPRGLTAQDLAIDAAVPVPEPVNLPPPTAADFKPDSTGSVAPAQKAATAPARSETTTATAPVAPQAPALGTAAASPTATPAQETAAPRASTVAAADQPVAEAALQVKGDAGEHQIDGAKVAVGHAYGGGSQFFAMWVVGTEKP